MKVSIVLALHNGAAHLTEQIQSILQGTRMPDEWVVVDDASTDASESIAADLLAQAGCSSVKLLRNAQNIGATRSFVAAVTETTGDVVLFCDQDDIWYRDKVSALCEVFIEDPTLLLAYHDGDIIDVQGVPDGRTIWGTRRHAQLSAGIHRDPMEVAANPDIKGCTMALNGDFARKLLKESPANFPVYWGHDHWCALMAWGSRRVKASPERLIQHRLHAGNTSGDTGFNAFSPSHWRRRLHAMRNQAPDHFVQRYALASLMAKSLSSPYDQGMAEALDKHLCYAERRMQLKGRNILKRMTGAWGLWGEGYYQRYANGAWTLLRDILA